MTLNEITDFVNDYLENTGVGSPYPKNKEGFHIFVSSCGSMTINLHAVLQDVVEEALKVNIKQLKDKVAHLEKTTNSEDIIFDIINLLKSLEQVVSQRKFAVEWMRNVNYGIGSGTEYFYAETREEALKLFWNGKNKEAFDVGSIYVC